MIFNCIYFIAHIHSADSVTNFTSGKCSHGGPTDTSGSLYAAVGGINKDTGNPLYSPHYHLHGDAAEAAIKHTRMFLVDKGKNIKYNVALLKFSHTHLLKV